MSKIKVVYNARHGGFSLSAEGQRMLFALGGVDPSKPARHNPSLVRVVETLGAKANGSCAQLCIVEIEGNKYHINEAEGLEQVITPGDITWIMVDTKALEKMKEALAVRLGADSERPLVDRIESLEEALQEATRVKSYAEVALLAARLEKLEAQAGAETADEHAMPVPGAHNPGGVCVVCRGRCTYPLHSAIGSCAACGGGICRKSPQFGHVTPKSTVPEGSHGDDDGEWRTAPKG